MKRGSLGRVPLVFTEVHVLVAVVSTIRSAGRTDQTGSGIPNPLPCHRRRGPGSRPQTVVPIIAVRVIHDRVTVLHLFEIGVILQVVVVALTVRCVRVNVALGVGGVVVAGAVSPMRPPDSGRPCQGPHSRHRCRPNHCRAAGSITPRAPYTPTVSLSARPVSKASCE